MATERVTLQRRESQVWANQRLSEDMGLLRLHVPGLQGAQPGQFIHITCGSDLTLPRPFSILDSQPAHNGIDILYRVVGQGTQRMATWEKGYRTPLLGPIGRPFTPPPTGTRILLVAGGVGLAPLDFFARQQAARGLSVTLLWGIESDPPFPATEDHARPGLAKGLALSHLLDQGIHSRFTSLTKRDGFYHGYVTELAAQYVEQLSPEERAQTKLYTCGPMPMMAALARAAATFARHGEASLEARMACGFGACVGCVTPLREAETWHYRRVCVDGPVFPLADVIWEAK